LRLLCRVVAESPASALQRAESVAFAVRNLRVVATFAFDPTSAAARRLARNYLPHLERWDMRVPAGHIFIEDSATLLKPGRRVEVGAPQGRQLAERGYELVSIRRVRARD
jgi:hypothetical protein